MMSNFPTVGTAIAIAVRIVRVGAKKVSLLQIRQTVVISIRGKCPGKNQVAAPGDPGRRLRGHTVCIRPRISALPVLG